MSTRLEEMTMYYGDSIVQMEVLTDDELYELSVKREARGAEGPSVADKMMDSTLQHFSSLREGLNRKKKRYQLKTGLGLDVTCICAAMSSSSFVCSPFFVVVCLFRTLY